MRLVILWPTPRNILCQKPPWPHLLCIGSWKLVRSCYFYDKFSFLTNRTRLLLAMPFTFLLDGKVPFLRLDYRRWPRQLIQPKSGNTPKFCLWMPSTNIPLPNTRARRSFLLRNAQTVSWITSTSEYFYFKDEIIKWVNNRLENISDATNELTIGGIMCMMSWEVR